MGRTRKTDAGSGYRPLAIALDTILKYHNANNETAAQIALRSGISQSTLSDYRTGRVEGKISVWQKLCASYGFRLDQFCRFAWDLQRGMPEQEALRLLFDEDPESNKYLKYKTDYDDDMDHIFSNLKQWWNASLHHADRDRHAASRFLSYISMKIPDFGNWYSRRNIIKNPAECGA